MKKYTTTLLALAISTSMSFAGLFDASPSDLKVKGMYIGMPIEEALVASKKMVEGTSISAWAEQMEIKKEEDESFRIIILNGFGMPLYIVSANKEGSVEAFAFEWPMVNTIFNASDMSLKEFAQMFIDAYKIPELQPDEKHENLVYTFPSGVLVGITKDKGVVVRKTTSQTERKSAFN